MHNFKYSLGLYEKAIDDNYSLFKKLTITKQLGFDFFEMSIDENEKRIKRLKMDKDSRIKIVTHCLELGITIDSLCLSANRKYPIGHLDDAIANYGVELIIESIKLASDLGIRVILLSGYDIFYGESTKETRERFRDNLKVVVDYASFKAVYLSIETMDTNFIDTCYKALYYCDLLNSPYLGIYLDTGNITNAAYKHNINILDDIKVAKNRITNVHFKDARIDEVRNVKLGKGLVEFEGIIELLSNIGIRKYVIEQWYAQDSNWIENIKYAKKYAKNILDKYYK